MKENKQSFRRSFRFVCQGKERKIIEEMLLLQGFSWEQEKFFSASCRLVEEPFPLGSSLAGFFGFIYIQDRASMLPPVALMPAEGSFVLDMCASPGSKTGQLAQIVGETGFVLGNEVSPQRLATLRRNLQQMGLFQTASCCFEGQHINLPDGFCASIQLDPPCSGWGTIEKNPKVMDMWKEEKTVPLVTLQKELLKKAERLLKPDGVLVYSTCTTNVEENEEQLRFAIEELGLELAKLPELPEFAIDTPLLGMDGVWRLSPKIGDTQGFFVARLQKKNTGSSFLPEEKTWGEPLTKKYVQELGISEKYLACGNIAIFKDSVHFVPRHAKYLPQNFPWQGMYMGKVSKSKEVQLSPRIRMAGDLPVINFEGKEGIEKIKGLLSGQSFSCDFKEKNVFLAWNGLVLGRLKVKNKRLVWSER